MAAGTAGLDRLLTNKRVEKPKANVHPMSRVSVGNFGDGQPATLPEAVVPTVTITEVAEVPVTLTDPGTLQRVDRMTTPLTRIEGPGSLSGACVLCWARLEPENSNLTPRPNKSRNFIRNLVPFLLRSPLPRLQNVPRKATDSRQRFLILTSERFAACFSLFLRFLQQHHLSATGPNLSMGW